MVKKKIRKMYSKPILDTSKRYKNEIKELEEKKKMIAEKVKKKSSNQKGIKKIFTKFGGAVAVGSINKEIRSRNMVLNQPRRLENLKKQIEIEKAQEELKQLRKKRIDIFGNPKGAKEIGLEDLY